MLNKEKKILGIELPCCAVLSHFSDIGLFVTLWSVVHQAPLSMGFSRREYSSHLLLQGIFPTQKSNSRLFCLPHWQAGSLH